MLCSPCEPKANAADGDADAPIHEGFLLRKGKWRWSRRRIRLTRGRLAYSSTGAPRTVDLADATVEDVDEPGRHDVAVVARGARYAFRCESGADKARWLRALAAAAAGEAAPAAAAAPPERPVVFGVLVKKGAVLWNRRCFVVRRRCLEWADEAAQDRGGGRLRLAGGRVERLGDARFRVVEAGDAPASVVVRALDGADAERWIRVLEVVCARDAPRRELRALWDGGDRAAPRPGGGAAAPGAGSAGAAAVVVVLSALAVAAPRLLVALIAPLVRFVVVPLVVVVANAYFFRQRLVARAVDVVNARWALHVARAPRLDVYFRRADDALLRADVVLEGIVLEDPARPPASPFDDDSDAGDADDDDKALAAVETATVGLALRRVGRSRRLRLEASAELAGVVLTYASYDARFRDTNLSRLIAAARGGAAAEDAADAAAAPEPATDAAAAARSVVFRAARLKRVEVRLEAVGALGRRRLGSVTLEDESVDAKKLGSWAKVLVVVNGLALRSLVNLSFDTVDAVLGGATGLATTVAFAPLDAADALAEKFGGSRVVEGVTGGVRGVVGGVVGGGVAVVEGVGASGRALVRGATTGNVTQGLGDAATALGGGLVRGVTSSVGGVVDGVGDVAGGVVGGARATASSLAD